MKKKILLCAFAVCAFASAFADKVPRIEVSKQGGKMITSGGVLDKPYIGYNRVESKHSGFGPFEKVVVTCSGNGYEVCEATINGVGYMLIPAYDESASYNFDSAVLLSIVNSIIEEIEQIPLDDNGRNGEKSKTISICDANGIQRLVAIRCIYNMDKALNGNTLVYIDVIK